MEPEVRNLAQLKSFIKEHPKEADLLALKWQELVKTHPEVATFETAREFYTWANQRNIDQSIWSGKEIQDVYFYLREKHEESQMQIEGRVNPRVFPAYLPYLPILAVAFLKDRPKIIEHDKDYQKIAQNLKKLWLENNPGKDFKSREGIDYLHRSLENENAPNLRKDAEKIFRENPKYRSRVERYDKEKKKIYKDPNDDPIVVNLRITAREEVNSRRKYLGAPVDINLVIQKHSLEKFIKDYPEKAGVYTKKGGNIVAPQEYRETKEGKKEKTLLEKAKDIYDLYKKGKYTARVGRATQRFAETTALNIARVGGRFVFQGGRAAITGIQTTMQAAMLIARGTVSGVFAIGSVAWIVIAVIIAIIIIVFLIIMFAGGGGGSAPAPTVDCVDKDGNAIVVADGNTCAVNTAAYYSNLTGIAITATCLDKCSNVVSVLCDRNAINTCTNPSASCGTTETFCIQYSPLPAPIATWLYDCNSTVFDYTSFASCSGSGIITPTPTP